MGVGHDYLVIIRHLLKLSSGGTTVVKWNDDYTPCEDCKIGLAALEEMKEDNGSEPKERLQSSGSKI